MARGAAYKRRPVRAMVARFVALGVIAAVGAPVAVVGAAAGAVPAMVRPSRLTPPHLPQGATRVGPVTTSSAINLEVVLAPSHQGQLTSLLHSLNDVGSAEYHRWLTPVAFARRFGPTPTAVSRVETWLADSGLRCQ